jgi:topoisomerase IA-like protein
MENKNIFLGKIQKNGCYVNNGQYGYFLTCNKVNYKIPEWMPHEKVDLEIAERLIAYKNKMSEQYLVTKEKLDRPHGGDLAEGRQETAKNNKKDEDDEESTEEEPRKMVLTKTKVSDAFKLK